MDLVLVLRTLTLQQITTNKHLSMGLSVVSRYRYPVKYWQYGKNDWMDETRHWCL